MDEKQGSYHPARFSLMVLHHLQWLHATCHGLSHKSPDQTHQQHLERFLGEPMFQYNHPQPQSHDHLYGSLNMLSSVGLYQAS